MWRATRWIILGLSHRWLSTEASSCPTPCCIEDKTVAKLCENQQPVLADWLPILTRWVPRVFLRMCSRGPEIHLCFLQNFADKTTDGKIRFSVSFLVSFKRFFHEEFFGRKECFIQPNFPRAFLRWKNARRASDVYVRRWPHRGVTLMTYIYVVGTERVNIYMPQLYYHYFQMIIYSI